METETMTRTDLEKLVDERAAKLIETSKEQTADDVEARMSALVATETDSYLKDQLKEQMQDALNEIKVPNVERDAAEKAGKEFGGLNEFLIAIRNHRLKKEYDPRLGSMFVGKDGKFEKTAGHMEIGEDSQGGFLVPEIFRKDLKVIALENSVVRSNGPMIIPPIKSDSIKIPYVNDTSHASTVFGGVSATWTGEAVTKTATKPTFGQMELTPHKLAGVTYTSNELLADSAIALAPFIRTSFGRAWGYFEDDAFINGTGAGQPLGILNCN